MMVHPSFSMAPHGRSRATFRHLRCRRLALAIAALGALIGCDSTSSGLDPGSGCSAEIGGLEVGRAAHFEGASARNLCVAASTEGEEFVLVTTSLQESGTTRFTLEGEGATVIQGPPIPTPRPSSPAPPALAVGAAARGILPPHGHHAHLREIERRELWPKVGAPSDPGEPIGILAPAPPRSAHPEPGDLWTLNTQSESACEDPELVTARVEAVSNLAIVVADTGNPSGGFDEGDFAAYAAMVDTLIAPVAEEHFGAFSDIDRNGRVILFFTKEVNGLGSNHGDVFTAGFFFSRDLFPKVSPGPPLSSCASSNEAELLYLIVPDPSGMYGSEISAGEVRRLTGVTIAHEIQHLINASSRLLDPQGPRPFEETWLNEALSHSMEELLFYRRSGLSPGSDLGFEDLDEDGMRVLNEFQRLNFLRLVEHLMSPGSSSPFDPDASLASRGAAWAFLRYAADRRGGDDASFFRELVDSPTTGLQNLSDAIGGTATVFDWLADWSVGLYGDNRVPNLDTRFADRSWNHYSLFDSVGLPGPYIQTSSIARNPLLVGHLIGGASGYFRFAVSDGETARLRLRSGGSAPPRSLRATVLRTR